MCIKANQNFTHPDGLTVLSTQEVLRRCGCERTVERVMADYVDPIHAKRPLSSARREGIRRCLLADVEDMLTASFENPSRFFAATPTDLSVFEGIALEDALSVPVIFPSNYLESELELLAATVVWKLLENNR